MRHKVLVLNLFLFLVALAVASIILGYNRVKIEGDIEGSSQLSPKDRCIDDSGCKTPMEYLVRSSCPFSSICINNQCKVVCRWEMEENMCKNNRDCNCSSFYMAKDSSNCSCIRGFCTDIVE